MSYTIYYWTACKNFWGRAIGVVLTLDEAGADYIIKDKDEAPANIGMAYPMITLDSGQSISQTIAILDVLGKQFNLRGDTEEHHIKCQQIVHDVDDIFSDVIKGKFEEDPKRAERWFTLLEHYLQDHKFLVQDTPTIADFHAVFAMEWVFKRFSATPFENFPKLKQWWDNLCAHPCVSKMKASGVQMIP